MSCCLLFACRLNFFFVSFRSNNECRQQYSLKIISKFELRNYTNAFNKIKNLRLMSVDVELVTVEIELADKFIEYFQTIYFNTNK